MGLSLPQFYCNQNQPLIAHQVSSLPLPYYDAAMGQKFRKMLAEFGIVR